MATSIETVTWGGWDGCVRLANERWEVIATTVVGPRVVSFGRLGGSNMLYEMRSDQGRTIGSEWRNYGGHRLWHAPEVHPRTYQPDNDPLQREDLPEGVRLTQPVEPNTGIRKSLALELHAEELVLTHTLTNEGLWPVRLAPWAITVMAPGGTAIFPQPPLTPADHNHLLPNRTIALWPYTPANDPRLLWGERFLRVKSDPAVARAIKVGTSSSEGWCGYVNGGRLFLKRLEHVAGAEYPDLGCGVECYTAGDFLELETLAPLVTLAPGASANHVERWTLHERCNAETEVELGEYIAPLVPGGSTG